ncbi:MAG: hypothetical protein M3480_06125, partial [Verrucomicrobiota bacterium]|nr:hypothetical protein [Verrucomicrobiota bacterium]
GEGPVFGAARIFSLTSSFAYQTARGCGLSLPSSGDAAVSSGQINPSAKLSARKIQKVRLPLKPF